MFSILQKLATNILGSKRVGAQITKGKPRFLALEPLEDRQLLSVSQFDEEIFGSSYYDEQEQQPYYDDALFSDEAMPGFSEELVPNDTFYEPDDLVFEPEEFSDNMVHGPLTYDEYCMIYAPWVFLEDANNAASRMRLESQGLPGNRFPSNRSPGNDPPNNSPPRGGGFEYGDEYVVTTLSDVVSTSDGVLSLREAIANANASSGTTLITFHESLSGTMTLNGTALPIITQSVDIIGPGADILTISGNDMSRIFYANTANTTITLAGMTLTNGSQASGYGGAVAISNANAVLYDLIIQDSQTAGAYGGGVYVNGGDSFVMDNCVIVGNQTPTVNNMYGGGAFIAYTDDVTITNSTFEGNASYNGGGLALYSNGQNHLDDVVLTDNTASYGGGLYATRSTSSTYLTKTNDIVITDSQIFGNVTTGSGGGASFYYSENVAISNTAVFDNTATSSAGGGMVFCGTGSSTISGSTIQGNSSGTYGGAVYATTTSSEAFSGQINDLVITDTLIADNSATSYGGGIYLPTTTGSPVTLIDSIVEGNTSERGGAVSQYGGTVTAWNTQFIGNQATLSGGGYYQYAGTSHLSAVSFTENTSVTGSGGAIFLTNNSVNIGTSIMTLSDSTLSNNVAGVKGGGLNADASSILSIYNTTISGNKAKTVGGITSTNEGGGIYYYGTVNNAYVQRPGCNVIVCVARIQ
jgi:predicted outer membrane repeat protein